MIDHHEQHCRQITLDLVWGAEAIGKAIGRSERQAKHMLSRGEIPGRKVNGRWAASLSALGEHFGVGIAHG